jgi:O-antigen/teichoic acid export membrane protein
MSGSVLRVTTIVVQALISFYMMPFLVQYLGDRNYGLWVLVGTVMGYYGFLDFGLTIAVSRFGSKYIGEQTYEEVNKIASTSFFCYVAIGAVALCLAIGSSLLTPQFLENLAEAKLFSVLMIIVGLTIATQFPMRALGGITTAMARYDVLAYIRIFQAIVRTLLIVYFLTSGYGLIALSLIIFTTETISNIIQLIVTFRIAPFLTIKWSLSNQKSLSVLYGYSWIAFVSSISDMMRTKVPVILVAWIFRADLVVFYTIALNLIEYFQQFITQALGIMSPVFSRFEGEEDRVRLIKAFNYMIVVNTIIATYIGVNMMFFGKNFILLWMGERFLKSVEILWLIGIPMTILLCQITTRDLFYGVSVHRYLAGLNLVQLLLMCMLSYAFRKYGAISIAYAFFASALLTELVKPYLAAKILKINKLTVYSTFLCSILSCISIIIPYCYVVNAYININSYLDIIIWGSIGTLYYVTLVYLFVITNDLKSILLRALPIKRLIRKTNNNG